MKVLSSLPPSDAVTESLFPLSFLSFGAIHTRLRVAITCLSVALILLSAMITSLSVTLTCLSVTITSLSVTLTCLSVTITCLSVAVISLSAALRRVREASKHREQAFFAPSGYSGPFFPLSRFSSNLHSFY